jgi:phosphatidate cytidylyltransferase
MLKTRIITAIVLLIGLLSIVFLASTKVWAMLTLVVVLLGVAEWSNLIRLKNTSKYLSLVIALIAGLFVIFMNSTPLAPYQSLVLLALLGGASFFWLAIAPLWLITRKTCVNGLVMGALGLLLILSTWVGLVGLHAISPLLLIGVMATVSIADSAAYFAGKRFGRHKLAPEISPGKTWEGVLGALVVVTVYGAALCYYAKYNLWLIVCMWLLVVLSIMGDLLESLLKRQAGLKDSGQLLPGHGGVLDRIDGFIPTLPITLFCIYLPLFNGFSVHG